MCVVQLFQRDANITSQIFGNNRRFSFVLAVGCYGFDVKNPDSCSKMAVIGVFPIRSKIISSSGQLPVPDALLRVIFYSVKILYSYFITNAF